MWRLTLLAAVVALAVVACGTSEDLGGEDPLVGMWETHHGYYVLRTADGVYNLGYTPRWAETDPFGRGTYTFDRDEGILTFTSVAGTHCGADSTGIYEAVIRNQHEIGDVRGEQISYARLGTAHRDLAWRSRIR